MLVSRHLPRLFQPTASAFIIALKHQPHLFLLIIWAVPGNHTLILFQIYNGTELATSTTRETTMGQDKESPLA